MRNAITDHAVDVATRAIAAAHQTLSNVPGHPYFSTVLGLNSWIEMTTEADPEDDGDAADFAYEILLRSADLLLMVAESR